ncbi:S41 family peptidase [Mucilaginibacter sp. cycad4]|uniref:S41 family peptidase n=1 Tax=Mucilaginibacter sp. cycad4 TaxID=3342096 RepID=UPI002AAB4F8C|nr:S41 family peptidase [Mucilaginibacter gossypii]WPV00867.1 S41 family peptidase [Mucilaginibacter gossypii]
MITALSCKKENVVSGNLPASRQWILDSMQVYYYWNETLPKDPSENNSVTSFFKGLLNSADRFSYLDDPDEIKTEYSSFGYYGFDYALLTSATAPGTLTATVTLVVPGSAADKAGLKRGDFFNAVNDIVINNTTSSEVQHILKQGGNIKLQLARLNAGTFINTGTLTLSALYFTEQPVYLTKTFSSAGKKTGYVFYDAFNGVFDRNMLDSLQKLGSAGISNLIIDLRYNPGGDVSSAAKIAGVLTPTEASQTFVIYQANKNGGRSNRTFQQTMLENDYQPQLFSEIKSRRISPEKIIVLTTAATASSAELLINTLKPYASVIQIGQTTIGKDMASFAIADERKPALVNLVLHPLVFKLYDANGNGDYSSGLVPDYQVDEFSELPLKQFGDPADPLLNKALTLTGNLTTATVTKNKIALNATTNTTLTYHSALERAVHAAPVSVRHVKR